MSFQFLSKTNMGILATLFLIILLTHTRIFDFLFFSPIGRAILIVFILAISYTNHILGVISILFIIIFFNQSNISYIDGFTSKHNKQSFDTLTNSISSVPKSTFVGSEGFNIIDRENTILRGKQSNQISMFSSIREQNEDIEPSDKSIFSNIFSTF